jgi:hypothetical protein
MAGPPAAGQQAAAEAWRIFFVVATRSVRAGKQKRGDSDLPIAPLQLAWAFYSINGRAFFPD